jgi:formylglycine-generating enzyme required for sulfatase activity/WD40 repeat protein
MAHDVFISHSSKDKTIADAACACLESRGIRCWVAPRDIVAGADWGSSIIDGINGAKAMVLILSSHSNVSKQVLREIERATSRGIPVVPLRVEDVVLSKSLEYFLSSAHWLDAYKGPLKQHLQKLANNTAVLLEKQDAVRPMADSSPHLTRPAHRSVLLTAMAFAGFFTAAGLGVAWFALREPPKATPAESLQPPDEKNKVTDGLAKRFYLGLELQDILPAVAEKLGAPNALTYVNAVSPEQKSGVRPGDIIVQFGQKSIGRSQDLVDALSAVTEAQQYPLTVVRGGTTRAIKVDLRQTPWPMSEADEGRIFGERRRYTPSRNGRLMTRLVVAGNTMIGIDVDNAAYAWTKLDGDTAPVSVGPRTYSAVGSDASGKTVVLVDAKTGELVRWEPTTSSITDVLEGSPNAEAIDLLVTNDGQRAVIVDKEANVRTWSLSSRNQEDIFSLKEAAAGHDIASLWALSPGDFSLSGNGRHLGHTLPTAFVIWDLEKKAPARIIRSENRITAGRLSPDAASVAIAIENGTIELWDVATERKRGSLRWHSKEVSSLLFLSPDFLVSACEWPADASAIVWNLHDQSIAWGFKAMQSGGPFAWGPKLLAFHMPTNTVFMAISSIWQLALPPDIEAAVASSKWNADTLLAVMDRPLVPKPSSTSTRTSSSVSATFADGKTREIVELDDDSKMITERDSSGNLIGMRFVPGPATMGLGVRIGAKDGSQPESHTPFKEGAAVLELVPGGAAAREGILREGDVITAVTLGNETAPRKVDGLRWAEIQRLIMGPDGSTVGLHITRSGASEPIAVTVTRGRILPVRRKAVRSDFTNSIGMEFVVVPAGIGSLGIDGDDGDMKHHYVRMSKGYLIGTHEVTQNEFAAVMKAQPSAFSPGGQKAKFVQDAAAKGEIPHADTAHHPVENVSWEEAVEFCKRLGEKEGRRYRLPTEAEWEWSCRDGGKTEWKTQALSGAWIDETAVGTHIDFPKTTHPVGSRSPNDAGIYDMFGNVAEWCADKFTESGFAEARYVDPIGPVDSLKHVVRGGSFTDFDFKFFTRSGLAPAEKRPYVGFRVVLEAVPGIVSNPDRERTLLERNTVTVNEKQIPDPLPPVDPPLRSPGEEEKELQEIIDTPPNPDSLNASRTRLKTSGFLNQTQFINLRGPWAKINSLLGNSRPAEALTLYNAGHLALNKGDSAGLLLYQQAAAKDSLCGFVANDTAWQLATNTNPEHRDPPLAIVKAIEACEESKWQHWGFLDTLAAALAADGRHETATRVAEAALMRAPEADKKQLEHALARYRQGLGWESVDP